MNFKNDYQWYEAYCRSKIANILFTRELQAKMDVKGIEGKAFSLHPGVIPTDIVKDTIKMSLLAKVVFTPVALIFMKNTWEGAQTTLYLTLESDEKLKGGEYYKDCKFKETTQFASDMENASKLWKVSEEMLGSKFDL